MISLGGVRALHGFFDDTAPTGGILDLADIALTSALLAGGSEAIHRIANAYNSFMDAVATRNERLQKT